VLLAFIKDLEIGVCVANLGPAWKK
jgi:hypothetical protein